MSHIQVCKHKPGLIYKLFFHRQVFEKFMFLKKMSPLCMKIYASFKISN